MRQGWAVQSFGYRRWLPLGKPECLVQNLDRWGADGIVVLVIDRCDQGPDLKLIERLSALGLSTPLTYGGGLATQEHARSAVRAGAERLVLDTVLSKNPDAVQWRMRGTSFSYSFTRFMVYLARCFIFSIFGAQSQMPEHPQASSKSSSMLGLMRLKKGGQGFNSVLLDAVQAQTDLPLLAFGGLARHDQIRPLLERPQVAGVVVGNALNYCEPLFDIWGGPGLPVRLHNHC